MRYKPSILKVTLASLPLLGAAPPVFPNLPAPVTNNAVAVLGGAIYSFGGLHQGKTWSDVTAQTAVVDETGKSELLPPLPDGKGRLASTATTVDGNIFVFGGYTVAEDGTEISTPDVWAYDPASRQYWPRAPMPVPVDDSVSIPYAGRYVYLISGWHNDDNVSLVQVFDTLTNRWFRATDFPGKPVFGHSGGLVGRSLVIIDGVAVLSKTPNGKRQYGLASQSWRGDIDPKNPAQIGWHKLPDHPGPALYRAAAVGSDRLDRILFAGGSDNPYNYNGIGYDKRPSAPSAKVFAFAPKTSRWEVWPDAPIASMDHRGLLELGGHFCTAGGMTANQTVTARISCWRK